MQSLHGVVQSIQSTALQDDCQRLSQLWWRCYTGGIVGGVRRRIWVIRRIRLRCLALSFGNLGVVLGLGPVQEAAWLTTALKKVPVSSLSRKSRRT